MNRESLYHKTVGILVDAYFRDELEARNCYACAVGNIVAANMGIKMMRCESKNSFKRLHWENYKPYSRPGSSLDIHRTLTASAGYLRHGMQAPELDERQRIQLESTGYTLDELAMIEFAFEDAYSRFELSKDVMYEGLMAVITVLDQIHENTDEIVSNNSKQKFNERTSSYTPALAMC